MRSKRLNCGFEKGSLVELRMLKTFKRLWVKGQKSEQLHKLDEVYKNDFTSYLELADCEDNSTPLYLAAKAGFIEVVKFLLDKEASPNIESRGQKPFDIAAEKGHYEVVELLFEAEKQEIEKYSNELQNFLGEEMCVSQSFFYKLILYRNVQRGFKENVEILLARASDNININYETLLDVANEEITELLENHRDREEKDKELTPPPSVSAANLTRNVCKETKKYTSI